MRIRTLVPALACLAAAPLATAAEGGPTVKIDGFVDSILAAESVIDAEPSGGGSNTEFTYGAKLGITATITEKVLAQVDIVADGEDGSADIRQAYGQWKITPLVDIKTGKFISDVGWIAAYAPGLYRVNTGPIFDLYGQDQVGARVGYAKDKISAGLTVANGFFVETDNVGQSDAGQGNEKFAYVVDVVYGSVKNGDKFEGNVELAYDTDVTGKGGDGLHFGLNGTFAPNEQLTAGAEFIYQSLSAPDGSAAEDSTHMGLMVMANYKLGAAMPVPASVTGMIQYVSAADYGRIDPFDVDGDGFVDTYTLDLDADGFPDDIDASITEISLALLTQPAGTENLSLNFEVYYQMLSVEPSAGGPEATEDVVGLAAELLYVF